MNQVNMVTAGVAGCLALILFYVTLRLRLVATSGEGETRSVDRFQYRVALMSAWMSYSGFAIKRMLWPTLIIIAPVVALRSALFGEGTWTGFSVGAYLYAVVLVIAPTLIVARRSFDEGRDSSPTSDMQYARKRAAASNRAILLMAFFAAVLYAVLVGLALMTLGAAWWIHGLIVVGILLGSFIVYGLLEPMD